jgi:hypothetical protein
MVSVANKPFMLSVIMLSVIMLSVIMLSVEAPFFVVLSKDFMCKPGFNLLKLFCHKFIRILL